MLNSEPESLTVRRNENLQQLRTDLRGPIRQQAGVSPACPQAQLQGKEFTAMTTFWSQAPTAALAFLTTRWQWGEDNSDHIVPIVPLLRSTPVITPLVHLQG